MKYCLMVLLLPILFSGCVNLKPDQATLDRYALGPIHLAETSPVEGGTILYIAQPNTPAYIEADRMYLWGEDGKIRKARTVRWAEPFNEGLARALSEYIELNSPHQVSAYYPWQTQGTERCTVQLNVYKLIALDAGKLLADIGWRINASEGEATVGRYQASFDWDPVDFVTYVAAMNAAVEGLANELSSALSSAETKK